MEFFLSNKNKPYFVRIPGLGRIALTREAYEGAAAGFGGLTFGTNLKADYFHKGIWQGEKDLGSGLITNVGALAIANDFNWPNPTTAINTLKNCNYHASGTGTNAATASDISLQTSAGPSPAAGTQTLQSAANSQKLQTVATLNYTSSLAITEWGLHNSATLTATTGTPFTAGTATTGTVTGTPYTASSTSAQGQTQMVFHDTTNATPFWGLCTSNTTSVITVPAWYKVSDGTLSASNPANADAFTIRALMLDRKVFTAINVVSGDSIQFTYTLTVSSGT